MRIAQVATLATPVKPGRCGSVESLVWSLSRELVELGHDVTIFACEGSESPGELVTTLPGPYAANGSPLDWQLCEWLNLCAAVAESDRFDLMHSHAYLWGLPLEPFARCAMAHTTHITPYPDAAAVWRRYRQACVTAVSRFQWSAFPDLQPAAVIPHGLDVGRYTFSDRGGDYLAYFGRFKREKGPLAAVSVARSLGMRLRLAGPVNDYYQDAIAPHVDGDAVEYVGYLEPAQRDEFLGGAAALVYPVQSPEPFGLVLVEAMLCGTPVAAIGRGAVPEIVEEGVTGAWELPERDLGAAVERALALDRRRVREHAAERFGIGRMAAEHLELYERELIAA